MNIGIIEDFVLSLHTRKQYIQMEKNKKISCFLAYSSSETMASLMAQLPMGKGEIVDQVFFLAAQSAAIEGIP